MRLKKTLSVLMFSAALLCGTQVLATPASINLRPAIDASLSSVIPGVASVEITLPGYSAFFAANGGAGEFGAAIDVVNLGVTSGGLSDASPNQVAFFGTGLMAFTGTATKTGAGTFLADIAGGAIGIFDSSVTAHSDTLTYSIVTGEMNDPALSPFAVTLIDQLSGFDAGGTQIATDLEALSAANGGWNIVLRDSGGAALGGATAISFFDSGGSTIMLVSAVPVPAAVWLFGSALLGLAAIRRRLS